MWLLDQKYFIAIAHNLRAYDGVFIMKYLTQNPLPKEKISVLMSGTKLISIQVKNIKIIDSFNFIPLSIAKFPTTFQIDELHKGYYPHLVNTIENQNKIFKEHPPQEFYGSKFMSAKDRLKFIEWHQNQDGKEFDLQKEVYKYCHLNGNIYIINKFNYI